MEVISGLKNNFSYFHGNTTYASLIMGIQNEANHVVTTFLGISNIQEYFFKTPNKHENTTLPCSYSQECKMIP